MANFMDNVTSPYDMQYKEYRHGLDDPRKFFESREQYSRYLADLQRGKAGTTVRFPVRPSLDEYMRDCDTYAAIFPPSKPSINKKLLLLTRVL